tara:strand:+ start:1273 stop:1878 length:606 start_codon:yes stop_codon:yes gene_type:complete
MSQLKLTADGGGGTVAIKGPASTTGNNAFELTVPGTASATLDTLVRAGNILQVKQTTKTDTASQVINTGSDFNPTFLRQSITTTGSNKVLIEGVVNVSMTSEGNVMNLGLRRNNSDVGVGDADGNRRRCTSASFHEDNYNLANIYFSFLDSPSAGTHEYHLQFSHSSGGNQTFYFNRTPVDTNNNKYPRTISFIRCSEVAA